MAVFTYEHKEPLTIENVRNEVTQHPRCGTSFIIVVILLSLMLYILIPPTLGLWMKLAFRIALLPLIVGVGFEFLRFAGKHQDQWFVRMLSKPGIWTQYITTKDPDDQMIEVAIASLSKALEMEGHEAPRTSSKVREIET